MIAEGKNIEVDIVTQSTYYLESAQDKNNMFVSIKIEINRRLLMIFLIM